MADVVRVRCRQTGFRTAIPVSDWDAYTEDQRAAYAVESATPSAPMTPEPVEGQAVAPRRSRAS